MITIKGPISVKKGDFATLFKEHGVKIKLPFTATGFTSTKTPDGVDMSGIEAPVEASNSVPIVVETVIVEPTAPVVVVPVASTITKSKPKKAGKRK